MPRRADTPLADASRGERLQRVLADAGVASRRACEEMILAGRVRVNGEPVRALPAWADPAADRIEVDGRPIPRTPPKHLYILLNKPERTLTSAADEPGADRRTVVDLVDHPLAPRLFPVGRLDYDTTGLLLLTNDGELANRLTHPRYGVPKTYRAKVAGVIGDDAIAELERGIYLAERKAGSTVGAARTSHVELAVHHRERDATWLDITLREGRNRQVRRMLAAVDLPVKHLERIAVGPLQLRGVARGQWRELSLAEVGALRRAAADARMPGAKANPKASPKAAAKPGSGAGSAPSDSPSPRPKPKKKAATGASRASGPRSPNKAGSKKAGSKKSGSKAPAAGRGGRGRGRAEPPPPPPAAKVRRRTVKNAINRAARDGRSRG